MLETYNTLQYLWEEPDVCDFAVPPSLDLSSPFAFSVGLESAFDACDSLSFDDILPVNEIQSKVRLLFQMLMP